jgi:micrococcal nuclease
MPRQAAGPTTAGWRFTSSNNSGTMKLNPFHSLQTGKRTGWGRKLKNRHGLVFILICSIMLAVISSASAQLPEQFKGLCVRVPKGDEITIRWEDKDQRVRLDGIDAPDKGQPFALRAKQFVSALALNQEVVITVRQVDRYGRIIGTVELPDGRILNHALIQEGLAWWFPELAPDDTELSLLQLEAQGKRRNIWSEPSPTPPWEFRRKN